MAPDRSAGGGGATICSGVLPLLLACTAAPGPPVGVVIVSLDTLRVDRLGAWGSTAGLTPNLDRFASESVRFEHAYSPSNETLYSHAALFTGRYPSRLDSLDGEFAVPTRTPLLAEVFADAGWDRAAFVAGGHLSRSFGLDRGFREYHDSNSWGSLQATGAEALAWLDTRSSEAPFFLFVHGYDVHDRALKPSPFGYATASPEGAGLGVRLAREVGGASRVLGGHAVGDEAVLEVAAVSPPRHAHGVGAVPLDPGATALTAADRAHLADVYDGAVAWLDLQFGRLVAGLEERGLLDDVVVVVVADHGEELGENGVFAHRSSMDDAVLHVPLLVRLPGGARGGQRVAAPVSLLDVAPTVLALAEVPAALYGDGQSLVPVFGDAAAPAERVMIAEGGLRLLSARSPRSRLTVEGISLDNAYLPEVLRVGPLDGETIRLSGAPDDEPALRRALLAHLAGR